jgi:D-alanine-D-alanine ligase
LDKSKYEIIQIAITKNWQGLSGADALDRMEKGDQDSLEAVTLIPEPGKNRLYHWDEDGRFEILCALDLIFPVLHGPFGEDGTLQGMFEMAEIPYVGAGVLASSVGMDKGLFKEVMRAWNIPVVDFILVTSLEMSRGMDDVLNRAEALGPYPLFTKPANLGSSVGISKCNNRSDLLEGLMDAARYDRRTIVEVGLEAREIEVSVLGNEEPQASIPGEVIPGDEFYSYRAKYIDDTSELLIPAPLDETTGEEIRMLAVKAFKAIDGAGMARVDFLLDKKTGKPYLNEVNTLPGFTSISMYPKLWEASGLPYPELLDELIDLAMKRNMETRKLERTFEVG